MVTHLSNMRWNIELNFLLGAFSGWINGDFCGVKNMFREEAGRKVELAYERTPYEAIDEGGSCL